MKSWKRTDLHKQRSTPNHCFSPSLDRSRGDRLFALFRRVFRDAKQGIRQLKKYQELLKLDPELGKRVFTMKLEFY